MKTVETNQEHAAEQGIPEAAQKNVQFNMRITGIWKVQVSQYELSYTYPAYRMAPVGWKHQPVPCNDVYTGMESGVVGLVFRDHKKLHLFEKEFGPLPCPRIVGRNTLICFHAPQRQYKSKKIMDGIW